MSRLKISMSVDQIPYGPGVPTERQGLLQARISVVGHGHGDDITLLSDRDQQFGHADISAMLRHFADTIDRKYSDKKEAA